MWMPCIVKFFLENMFLILLLLWFLFWISKICSLTNLFQNQIKSIIWKASGRNDDDDDAPLLPRPSPCLGRGCCSFTLVSISAGGASLVSSACSSLGIRILLLRIIWESMGGVGGIRPMCCGVYTPLLWRILIIKFGTISFDLKVVFVDSTMMLYKCALMSM